MTCKITELRKQMNAMQALLDTYEHCHVDSVTPEEKAIIERVKAKCIEAIDGVHVVDSNLKKISGIKVRREAIKAIMGVSGE